MEQRNKFRRSKPSSDFIIRKFFREIQQSRLLSDAKKRRFFSKDVSRTEKRTSARRKAMIKKIKRGY